MASPKFDRERAIKILVDAESLGVAKACKRWDVTDQTVRNYRRRLGADPEFLEALARQETELARVRRRAEVGWLRARTCSLRKALKRADALIANESDLDKITRYVDKLGNLDIASGALGVGLRDDSPSEAPAEDAGGSGPGESESETPNTLQ